MMQGMSEMDYRNIIALIDRNLTHIQRLFERSGLDCALALERRMTHIKELVKGNGSKEQVQRLLDEFLFDVAKLSEELPGDDIDLLSPSPN